MERETDRQKHTQRDRDTHRDKDRQTERQRQRDRQRDREIETERQRETETERQRERETETERHRERDRDRERRIRFRKVPGGCFFKLLTTTDWAVAHSAASPQESEMCLGCAICVMHGRPCIKPSTYISHAHTPYSIPCTVYPDTLHSIP